MCSKFIPTLILMRKTWKGDLKGKILGIDPGTVLIGYGLLEFPKDKPKAIRHGVIQINRKDTFPLRLKQIYEEVTNLFKKLNPDAVAIEEVYVSQNAKTTLRLGHARGVILLSAVNYKISISEYAPREIKQAVCGNGNASKEQIQCMVASMLDLNVDQLSKDAADALAVAVCHGLRCSGSLERM
jgi:crossover junction endodeoxyribonuclease RuvC